MFAREPGGEKAKGKKGRKENNRAKGLGGGRCEGEANARDKKNWRSRGAEKKEAGKKGSCERISRGENRREKRGKRKERATRGETKGLEKE